MCQRLPSIIWQVTKKKFNWKEIRKFRKNNTQANNTQTIKKLQCPSVLSEKQYRVSQLPLYLYQKLFFKVFRLIQFEDSRNLCFPRKCSNIYKDAAAKTFSIFYSFKIIFPYTTTFKWMQLMQEFHLTGIIFYTFNIFLKLYNISQNVS